MHLMNYDTHWSIAFVEFDCIQHANFTSVDEACDYLVDILSVSDDEVDKAVIDMTIFSHKIAIFDINNKYSHSEEKI